MKSYFLFGEYQMSCFMKKQYKTLEEAVAALSKEFDMDSGLASFWIEVKDKKTGKRFRL